VFAERTPAAHLSRPGASASTWEAQMTEHKPDERAARGDRLADLLLPYCLHEMEADEIDHEIGWWFRDTPPAITREALTLVDKDPGERPNDQPPEEWLVDQAEQRNGSLAGFVAPRGPFSPRMRVDAIIVPVAQVRDLAAEIAKLWPVEEGGTALDLAVVEGLESAGAELRLWQADGSEFAPGSADSDEWLGATFCSFWWD
jgi:hypothetical protein